MESHIQATMARIDEIYARISSMNPTALPPIDSSAIGGAAGGRAGGIGGVKAPLKPYDVVAAQATGAAYISPLGGSSAGPFTPHIEELISKYAAQNGVPAGLVRAVVQQESGGNPLSHSASGAMGLMQLMPGTAKTYNVTDAFDPEQNIAAGTRHLAGLMRNYNGDIDLALAAYNAGSNAVAKAGNKVPNIPETQDYVRRIRAMMGGQ